MNTKHLWMLMTLLIMFSLITACGVAATPEPLQSVGGAGNGDDHAGGVEREVVRKEVVVKESSDEASGDSSNYAVQQTAPPQPAPEQPISAVRGEGESDKSLVADDGARPEAPPNDNSYHDVFFENYGVNPFVDTEDDHLSTFATDVDTGSYTIMRRYVNDGYLPPKDSIRVEEFINYFEQNYEPPPKGQAFNIHVDAAQFPFAETERYRMMRVGLQGYVVPPNERKDVSLTFVIDVSGSMDMENRLGLVKKSLELLVEQLGENDYVSIVVYGYQAEVVLEPTSGDQKELILRAINSLRPTGSTNAEAGLRLGYQQALQAFNRDGVNRLVLCSDGVANVGNTGPDSILENIKHYASEGVFLTTVGFGMGNYNDVLMEQLADDGNGFYAYVDTLKEAKRLFVQDLTGTLQVIALDTKVQVDFNPQTVARYRLVGFENRAVADQDFRNDDVDAGEVGAGHSVTALYEIKLHPDEDGLLSTVYLRWEDPDSHEVTEINRQFYVNEMADSFASADPYFQWTVLVAEYAEVLRESYWAEGNTIANLVQEVERTNMSLRSSDDRVEFVNLIKRASQLE